MKSRVIWARILGITVLSAIIILSMTTCSDDVDSGDTGSGIIGNWFYQDEYRAAYFVIRKNNIEYTVTKKGDKKPSFLQMISLNWDKAKPREQENYSNGYKVISGMVKNGQDFGLKNGDIYSLPEMYLANDGASFEFMERDHRNGVFRRQ